MSLPKGYHLQKGKYCLTKVIGQGGFGITYLGVWNTEVKGELGKIKTTVPVCIKEYFFKDYCFRDETTFEVKVHSETGKILFDKFKEKQIEEAKILSEVHHPYIVNVLEVFEENNTAYIAMEHIDGCSLKSMLSTMNVLPEEKVLKYVSQIGQALTFVHQKNILHLDIKPNNILIDKHDNARLIDFGVSKRYDIEEQEACTTTLTLSKGFASIEQYDNEGMLNFSPCPDIYSLGATMYNLLTGEIPVESILRATKPLVKPSELNKLISEKTETAVLKAMRVNPIDRYRSVQAMIDDLDIPSYPDKTENTNDEIKEYRTTSNMPEEDESTQVSASRLNHACTDNEETVYAPNQKTLPKRQKKSKRRITIPLLILLFACAGWAVLYLLRQDNKKDTLVADALTQQQMEPMPPSDLRFETETPLTEQQLPDENTSKLKKEEIKKKESKKKETKLKTEEASIQQTSGTKTPADEEDKAKAVLQAERIEANYAALLSSGKTKMNEGNYADAKIDFAKAKDIKVTEEAIRLSMVCDEKIEEQDIMARKALYDASMPFGNYTIVRKKQNKRYGAIDSKGIERIKCIYLSVGRSDNGRAFEREDHLYDIYNSNGVLVGKGLTTY